MLVLKDDNFLMVAAALYRNPQCTTDEEFYDDLARIKYLKKLFTRFQETGDLKERLILNHIVVLSNVFGSDHLARLLYLKMDKQFSYVKPFLEYLSILPGYIVDVRQPGVVDVSRIESDPVVVERLGRI